MPSGNGLNLPEETPAFFAKYRDVTDALDRVNRDFNAVSNDNLLYGGQPDEDPAAKAYLDQVTPVMLGTQQTLTDLGTVVDVKGQQGHDAARGLQFTDELTSHQVPDFSGHKPA